MAVAAFLVYRNKSQVQSFEKTTHSAIVKTQQKAIELKTNVSTEVKAGMQRADHAVSNALVQVKAATTNTVHQFKKALSDHGR